MPLFFKKKPPLLLSPGPVLMHSTVRKALSGPMLHHRSQVFKNILTQVLEDLKQLFKTKNPVLILNSSGTGAMEAGISNTLSPGDHVLCLISGKFGERFKEIALAFGLKVHSLTSELGQAIKLNQFEEALKNNPNIKAVLTTACETSTGTEQPLKELADLLKQKAPSVLFIVDAITGLGSMTLNMDDFGIDVLITGSQKALSLPTGLSFIALSKKAWIAQKTSTCPKYYFDLKKEYIAQAKGQTAFSSSVSLIKALHKSLKLIKKQGLKNCILKCELLKQSSHVFCRELGLELFSTRPANAVTAIVIPKPVLASQLKNSLEKNRNIFFAGGQGPLKDKLLRIGHLGAISFSEHLKALKALSLELQKADPKNFTSEKIQKALKQAQKKVKNERFKK